MNKFKILEGITILCIILFLYTGVSKIMDYPVLKEQIATSPLLAPFSKFISISLPTVELTVTLLLAIPKWRLKGLYASLMLMTLFTLYIILILLFNKELPCSCGGIIELLSWNQHIILNSTFIALIIGGIVLEKQLIKANKKALSILTTPDISYQS